MLTLKNIVKNYTVADMEIPALRGVSINFRKSEFVSVLGQSGCGKTTLLNIIGGLDQYTEGDLIINGVSTKKFKDADWDTYRNHSIGFVFQSYNLIPHQSVLSNVELALTLSGVSKTERRKLAKEALEKVGLGDQLSKRPNQMSGGQMQRVAIARALVNNPDILLADEPTGALDSETSVQIMNILKEISKDKLIIMVTHNPDLAEQYSTRIVRLLDGKVTDDSDPYEGDKEETQIEGKRKKREKKPSMSFLTALSLSFNNLMTKKGRTFMTAFAGSIGIIGIALILSVSTGVQRYIDSVQRDTLSSYPITMQAETVDSSSLLSLMVGGANGDSEESPKEEHKDDMIYANSSMYEMMNTFNNISTKKNNLTKFKEFLDQNEDIKKYLSSVRYSYDMDMSIYTKDVNDRVVKSDVEELMKQMMSAFGFNESMMGNMGSMMTGVDAWEEMLPGDGDSLVHDLLKEQYDVVYGNWPKAYNEIVIVLNPANEVSDMVLYALGLTTQEKLLEQTRATMMGETVKQDLGPWTYEEMCQKEFRVISAAKKYQKQPNGTYVDLSKSEAGLNYLYDNEGVSLKIVGILRPNKDAISSSMAGAIGYTSALTDYVMDKNAQTDIVKEQMENKAQDVILSIPFETGEEKEATFEEITEKVNTFINTLADPKKAELYKKLMETPAADYFTAEAMKQLAAMEPNAISEMVLTAISQQMGVEKDQVTSYIQNMTEEELSGYAIKVLEAAMTQQYATEIQKQLSSLSEAQLAAALSELTLTEEQYKAVYENELPAEYSSSTYEENLKLLGYANANSPSAISIYADTFEDKDEIAALIKKYNESAAEGDAIEYTDYVALLMSSITTIINAISYVLIAFVAISLVVSSIMIGIITYISVLERTKEIGVLRAIGASKRDISRVFNAETLIVGFTSGGIGIIVSLFFVFIINRILHALTHIANLNAVLPLSGAIILILISMLLTLIAGLLPSRVAAKKDPVIALRSE